MAGDGGVGSLVEQPVHEFHVTAIDIGFVGIRQGRRLVVGALAQAHADAELVQAVDIGGAAVQIRLDGAADVAHFAGHGGHQGERAFGISGGLHVDLDAAADFLGAGRDAEDIVIAGGLGDIHAELRGLDRDRGRQAARGDLIQRQQVRRRRCVGLFERSHVLAQMIQGGQHSLGLQFGTYL